MFWSKTSPGRRGSIFRHMGGTIAEKIKNSVLKHFFRPGTWSRQARDPRGPGAPSGEPSPVARSWPALSAVPPPPAQL